MKVHTKVQSASPVTTYGSTGKSTLLMLNLAGKLKND